MLERVWKKGTLLHCWWECKLIQPLWKTVWKFLRKLKIELSSDSSGEGLGYPFQYSWASLVAQTVKNPPAMWEAWILFLGWEDPSESEMATHSSILAWRIPMDRGAWQATVHGVASWKWLSDEAQLWFN